MSGGFKGVVPRARAGKKTTGFDRARMVIGWSLTLALAAATVILFINLLSAGRDLAERKTKPKKTEYLQVIFKPKQNE